MNVLHTVASLHPKHGGPSYTVPRLSRALAETGITVALHVSELSGLCNLNGYVPTLLHDHGLWLPSNHAAAAVARQACIPRVVSPRGMLEPWALRHRRWKKCLAWYAYQRRDIQSAAVLHVTSEAEAESVRDLGLRTPLAIIPNGVDLLEARAVPERPGPRRALFLSRLHPIKGLPLLVEAWARVQPPRWELILAGPDERRHRVEVEALVRRLGLNRSVRFLGPVAGEDKEGLYHSVDLFVLPTHSENFGLVVAEALAAGLPVITTKGAPWAALETHRCGWWTEIGAEPLAAALREATALPDETRRAMGERGRTYVREHLSWDHVASQMRAVYEWVLGHGPQPACVVR
jgi:glycosyltransferase involved in cell wall biosynthesis